MSCSRTFFCRMIAVACLAGVIAAAAFVFPAQSLAQGIDRDAMLKAQRDQREMQYKRVQAMVASFPSERAKDVQDVMQLKVEGSALALVTPLMDTSHQLGMFRVTCDQFKGPTYVSVTPLGVMALGVRGPRVAAPQPGVPNAAAPRVFCFMNYEMPNPDEFATLTIQSYGEHLQINCQVRSGVGGVRSVMLVQQRAARNGAAPGQSPVQLSINEFGDNAPGGVPRTYSIQANDFQSLLREHGREAEEFIRPLFRQLGQEAALAPDGRIAWQVLADHWHADPDLAKKVKQLLPSLDNVDFHTRDKALSDLESMGMPGAAVLLHLDRVGLSPEQNLMIDRTLAPFAQLSAKDATRLRSDPEFLTDCLYVSDADVRAAALDRLRQITGRELSFDLNVPETARPAAVSELRKQLAANAAERPTTGPAKS